MATEKRARGCGVELCPSSTPRLCPAPFRGMGAADVLWGPQARRRVGGAVAGKVEIFHSNLRLEGPGGLRGRQLVVLSCLWGGEAVRGLEEELEEEDGGETVASGKESWRNSRKVKAILRLRVVCDKHPSPAFSNVSFQAERHVTEKPHIPEVRRTLTCTGDP